MHPKQVQSYLAPKIGAMVINRFRQPIHAYEHQQLRQYWVSKRKNSGLSQRDVATKLGVTRSLIGKIETGDRRLDVIETLRYASVLEIDSSELLQFLESIIQD